MQTSGEPRLQLLPGPVVHADLAAATALAAAHEQRAAPRVEIGRAERERLVNAQAGAPQHWAPVAGGGRLVLILSESVRNSSGMPGPPESTSGVSSGDRLLEHDLH